MGGMRVSTTVTQTTTTSHTRVSTGSMGVRFSQSDDFQMGDISMGYASATVIANVSDLFKPVVFVAGQHNHEYVLDLKVHGGKLRFGARECAVEVRVGDFHVCSEWSCETRCPQWNVSLGPFGVDRALNEMVIISLLGRNFDHGAKVLDVVQIPVAKVQRRGSYVRREFTMNRCNAKLQLEIDLKENRRMSCNF